MADGSCSNGNSSSSNTQDHRNDDAQNSGTVVPRQPNSGGQTPQPSLPPLEQEAPQQQPAASVPFIEDDTCRAIVDLVQQRAPIAGGLLPAARQLRQEWVKTDFERRCAREILPWDSWPLDIFDIIIDHLSQ